MVSKGLPQAFFDDANGEVLADLDSGDEAPVDETDMDDDAEAMEPNEVPDSSLHCFRGHAGPARARCLVVNALLLKKRVGALLAGVCCGR